MSLTAEQLLERRAYLGGTDAAALAGVNPPGWAQPIDVYLEKTGQAPERTTTRMQGMGVLLEDVVAGLFTEATGIKLRRPAGPVRSREYPWAGGHLDRWAADGSIFEAKWAMGKAEWGEGLPAGTDEAPTMIPARDDPDYRPRVPLRYAVQVQHYLAVTGRPLAYLAVLLGWADFRWYALWRDEPMIGTLMQLEERFWREHVLAGVPPEPDGSEGYGRHLRQLYASDDGAEAVATPEQRAMLDEYRRLRRTRDEYSSQLEAAAQRLQASMGTTARLVAPGATVTWRQQAERRKVDWEALSTGLLEDISAEVGAPWPATKKARAELVRAEAERRGHLTREPGSRPFVVTFDSDEESTDA